MSPSQRLKMNLDFGSGTLSVITHNGSEYFSFRSMCLFVGADYDAQLAVARHNMFASYLADGPGGDVLFQLKGFPMWLFVLPETEIAPEHRAGHRAFVREIHDSRILEPATRKLLSDLDKLSSAGRE